MEGKEIVCRGSAGCAPEKADIRGACWIDPLCRLQAKASTMPWVVAILTPMLDISVNTDCQIFCERLWQARQSGT